MPVNFSQAIKDAIIKDHKIGLILLDIDRFRWINEHAGMSAADNILASVGKTLLSNLKANEYAYRVGNDDFFVMTGVAQDSKKLIERARALSKLISKSEFEEYKVTVTVGATIQDPKEISGFEEVLNFLGSQVDLGRIKQGYDSIHYVDQIGRRLN